VRPTQLPSASRSRWKRCVRHLAWERCVCQHTGYTVVTGSSSLAGGRRLVARLMILLAPYNCWPLRQQQQQQQWLFLRSRVARPQALSSAVSTWIFCRIHLSFGFQNILAVGCRGHVQDIWCHVWSSASGMTPAVLLVNVVQLFLVRVLVLTVAGVAAVSRWCGVRRLILRCRSARSKSGLSRSRQRKRRHSSGGKRK